MVDVSEKAVSERTATAKARYQGLLALAWSQAAARSMSNRVTMNARKAPANARETRVGNENTRRLMLTAPPGWALNCDIRRGSNQGIEAAPFSAQLLGQGEGNILFHARKHGNPIWRHRLNHALNQNLWS